MTDLFSKFDDVIALRQGLLDSGRTDPFNLVMERVESPTVAICNGKVRRCYKGCAPAVTLLAGPERAQIS